MKYNHPKIYHKCDFCAYKTRTILKVQNHIKMFHAVEYSSLNGASGLTMLNDLSTLNPCQKTKRSNKPKQGYACNTCGKLLNSATYLKIHMKIHSGEKDHQCPNCPMKSTRKFVIRQHCLKVHGYTKKRLIDDGFYSSGMTDATDAQSYQCETCEYKTTSKTYLKVHNRKHTGEKPFACPVCSQKASRKFVIREHCMRVHNYTKQNLIDSGFYSLSSQTLH
jgi:KRAB domain-containing zinc finger protein